MTKSLVKFRHRPGVQLAVGGHAILMGAFASALAALLSAGRAAAETITSEPAVPVDATAATLADPESLAAL